MPQVKLKTRTPLSLSKVDLDSESEDELVVKKPRLDKPPVPVRRPPTHSGRPLIILFTQGRAASVEGGAAAASTPLVRTNCTSLLDLR